MRLRLPMLTIALALGCALAEAKDVLESRVETAWRQMVSEKWSPKTGLIYGTKPQNVKPAREFKDGLFRWKKGEADGYGLGMSDCSIVSGVGLAGLCDAYAVTRDESLRTEARRVARGLFANATAHGFKGFVARGICEEDGKSICALSSIDQHTHWFHGLWHYAKSPLSTDEDRKRIAALFVEVLTRIERLATPTNDYDFCQADGAPDPRGICHVWHDLPPKDWKSVHCATRLPMFYLATWDVTGDAKWKTRYERYADAALAVNLRLRDENPDQWKWIMPTYSLLQMACANEILYALESDPARKTRYADCLRAGARVADGRAKDMLAHPDRKWYGMCPDAELALAMLYSPDFDFDADERGILADRLRKLTPNNSLAVTHYFAAYWRARRRGLELSGPASAAAADMLVKYPDYPAAIERDSAYQVRVRQGKSCESLVVWNHCEKSALAERTRGGDVNRRFCEFAFAGRPVTVDIAVREDVRAYKVFPARLGLKHAFKDGIISVTLVRPCYFGIQLNDSDKTILSVFADAPERAGEIPAADAPGVMTVDGWFDAKGADGVFTVPADIREIYLRPGSVMNARLKIKHANVKLHGRGMVLDPMSDVFRYDQATNPSRGLVSISGKGCAVEGVKLIDARTFNFTCWAPDCTFRNVKVLATMMCSDGFTNGSRNLLVDNAWVYVGDNALVVSGVNGASYRNIAIGTSCKAIFPQGTNKDVKLENIDVFRADEGIIANVYNGALRRNNKWSETGQGLQKREPGPQDLMPQTQDFFFDTLSAVDATYVGYVFRGRNMGDLEKTFAFRNLSVPHVPGFAGWRGIGRTNGVSVAVDNDPARWLNTSNYRLTVTNLYLGGVRATAFPAFAVRPGDAAKLSVNVVADPTLARTVPLAADRVVVNWTCPDARKPKPSRPPANLLQDNAATHSIWQRCPSWLVKFDACRRDERGNVLYRLFQCEKSAGIQAVLTERVKAAGFGRYRLSFEAKAKSETPFEFKITARSNEAKRVTTIGPVELGGDWKTYETEINLDFDSAVTDLVSLMVATSATANEVYFRNFDFRPVSDTP